MHTVHRLAALIVILLVAALLPAPAELRGQDASAGIVISPDAILSCEDGDQPGGARYRICMPTVWNGGLVVYAHGYVAPNRPIGLPEDQLTLPDGTGVDVLVTSLGYAFAASGYRSNGLAVTDAISDSIELVDLFTTLKGAPSPVLLAGVSEGGLVSLLSLERHPQIYDGALAMCGPIGDFRRQGESLPDFRVVFDVFFPGLIPPTAIDVPPALLDRWETETYSTTVKPVVLAAASTISVTQLFSVTSAAYDAANEASKEATIERLLWYSIYATNDANQKLGGNPYDNIGVEYQGSLDDGALNAAVARFASDDSALAAIDASYQSSGKLTRPLVTMHTSGDPIVPAWHASLFRDKVVAEKTEALHEQYLFDRYGHCTFSLFEIVGAFNRLADLVTEASTTRVYLPITLR